MTDTIRMKRAFMAGVRHGRRLARKRAQRDTEDLMDELRERDDAAPYNNIVRFDPEQPKD